MSEARTLYDVLGVEPDAPPQKIQAIYRLRSREAYPRRAGEGDSQLQQQLNEAYRILKDPALRTNYNRQMNLPLLPRPLRPGKTIYGEIKVSSQPQPITCPYQFFRWEPCPRCWCEGCPRCEGKGRLREEIALDVMVKPGLREILIEGQGAISDPGGPRGDLILYVVRR